MNYREILNTILLIFLFSPAYAATYYVATTGSDTNTGAIDAPFATLGKAQSLVAAGDTVYIRGGVYKITADQVMDDTSSTTWTYIFKMATNGSSASKRIYYWGYPGERPVFDLSEIKPSGKRVIVFYVTKSYLHFKNFEVTGTQVTITTHTQSECFRNEGGNNNIYENLAMHDGMAIGFYLTKGFNNLVLNCDAYNNYDPVSESGAGGNVDGFGAHPNSTGSTGNVFKGCRAWYNSDDGFDFIGALTVVTIDSCWSFLNGYKPPDYGNLVSAGDGTGFKAGGYGMSTLSTAEQALITNNTVPTHLVQHSLAYYNKNRGFYSNHHLGGVTFKNNTAYRNPYNYDMTNRSKEEETPTNVPGYDHIIRNNVSYLPRSTGGDIYNVNQSACTIENNTFLNTDSTVLTLSDADFVSLDVAELTLSRQADGSLPAINFLRAANTSYLSASGMGYLVGDAVSQVTFGDISAYIKSGSLNVSWATLAELNNSYFEIEASTDGSSFSNIGTLQSAATNGTSAQSLQYDFVKGADAAGGFAATALLVFLGAGNGRRKRGAYALLLLFAGVSCFSFYACNKSVPVSGETGNLYIRIKQVGKNGAFTYSNTVKAVME
ncbi:MAG: hypothetical protein QM640_03880 [Niabella sp.]